MTQTLEQNTPSPQYWAIPASTGESALDSYARRIHWWVRLFGVFCVCWAALTVFAFVYFVARASSTGDSAYTRCVNRGVTVSTCQTLYGN